MDAQRGRHRPRTPTAPDNRRIFPDERARSSAPSEIGYTKAMRYRDSPGRSIRAPARAGDWASHA
jgi:hypothetical protein